MRKSGSLILLIILFLQAGGMLLFNKVQHCFNSYKIQEALNDTETHFQKITLTYPAYLQSKIKSDEICVDGKMYDVKSMIIKDNKVELLVIHDSDEEKILKKIKAFFNNSTPENSKLPVQLQQLLTLNYLCQGPIKLFFIPLVVFRAFHFINRNLSMNDSDIPYPPPKFS